MSSEAASHCGRRQKLHDQVRNGRRFADALAGTDCSAARDSCSGSAMETASPSIARHAPQFYEHKNRSRPLDRLMGAIGAATIILVSIVIGALIISIMSALLSITELAL
jgi:general secretion pathway protein F